MNTERFMMIVRKEIEEDLSEVSIIDTEEDNVELYSCCCQTEDLFFCKQGIEQVLRQLNYQDNMIKKLTQENRRILSDLTNELKEIIART